MYPSPLKFYPMGSLQEPTQAALLARIYTQQAQPYGQKKSHNLGTYKEDWHPQLPVCACVCVCFYTL